jgi:hypothetical protein
MIVGYIVVYNKLGFLQSTVVVQEDTTEFTIGPYRYFIQNRSKKELRINRKVRESGFCVLKHRDMMNETVRSTTATIIQLESNLTMMMRSLTTPDQVDDDQVTMDSIGSTCELIKEKKNWLLKLQSDDYKECLDIEYEYITYSTRMVPAVTYDVDGYLMTWFKPRGIVDVNSVETSTVVKNQAITVDHTYRNGRDIQTFFESRQRVSKTK